MNPFVPQTMILNRWTILSCCILLALAGAVFQKKREVTRLREEARRHAMLAGPAKFFGAATTRRERPPKMSDEFGSEEDENELLAGMSAFRSNGDLSEEAIKRLGLTKEEAAAANDAMYKFRAEATADLARRLKPTIRHSEAGASRQFYYARARRDRGQAPLDELTLSLGSIIGQDRSRRLMKAFTHDDKSARLCKLDLELEVVQPTEEGKDVTVGYQLRSPRDGGVTSFHGGVPLERFEKEYGKLFEVQGDGAE
jgi:hypothetical protein